MMARVFDEKGRDYILRLTGEYEYDALQIMSLLGGDFDSMELSHSSAILFNKDKGEWGQDVVLNTRATEHINKEYGVVMPVPGLAIIIDLDDYMVTEHA